MPPFFYTIFFEYENSGRDPIVFLVVLVIIGIYVVDRYRKNKRGIKKKKKITKYYNLTEYVVLGTSLLLTIAFVYSQDICTYKGQEGYLFTVIIAFIANLLWIIILVFFYLHEDEYFNEDMNRLFRSVIFMCINIPIAIIYTAAVNNSVHCFYR